MVVYHTITSQPPLDKYSLEELRLNYMNRLSSKENKSLSNQNTTISIPTQQPYSQPFNNNMTIPNAAANPPTNTTFVQPPIIHTPWNYAPSTFVHKPVFDFSQAPEQPQQPQQRLVSERRHLKLEARARAIQQAERERISQQTNIQTNQIMEEENNHESRITNMERLYGALLSQTRQNADQITAGLSNLNDRVTSNRNDLEEFKQLQQSTWQNQERKNRENVIFRQLLQGQVNSLASRVNSVEEIVRQNPEVTYNERMFWQNVYKN
jgi:hypothetical protein